MNVRNRGAPTIVRHQLSPNGNHLICLFASVCLSVYLPLCVCLYLRLCVVTFRLSAPYVLVFAVCLCRMAPASVF